MSCPLMFILGFWEIAANDGRLLTGVESDFHSVGGHPWAGSRQPEGEDVHHPSRVIFGRDPTTAPRLGEVSG